MRRMNYRFAVNCIRNFLVVNFISFLLLWFLCQFFLPSRMEISIDQKDSSVVEFFVDGVSFGKNRVSGYETFYLWVPNQFSCTNAVVRSDAKELKISSVMLLKWGIIRLKWSINGLDTVDTPKEWVAYGPGTFVSLVSRWVWGAVIGFELAIVFLSALFAAMCHQNVQKTTPKSRLACSALAAFFFTIVVPIQTYLANSDAFSYTFGNLSATAVSTFIIAFLCVWICMSLLVECFGIMIEGAVFAIVLCAYLESGLLSIGLPTLTGNMSAFQSLPRSLVDAIVLVFVFAISTLGYLKQSRWRFWMSAVLGLLSALSLLDVHVQAKYNSLPLLVDKFTANGDIASSVKYAKDGNVLVFMLDSLSTDEAISAFEDPVDGARLKKHFDGFTLYRNNIGVHAFTDLSTACMFTGVYFDNPIEPGYDKSYFGTNSVLRCFLNDNWHVYMMPAGGALGRTAPVGYTDEIVRSVISECTTVHSEYLTRIEDSQAWNLLEIELFRIVPFAVKRMIFDWCTRNWQGLSNVMSEEVMYEYLSRGTVLDDCRRSFVFAHTFGTHIPVTHDRVGHRIDNPKDDYQSTVEQAIYVLGQLGALFKKYRQLGIYDTSTIIVVADHGPHYSEVDFDRYDSVPLRAKPLLCVKPPRTVSPITYSEIPTSHSRFARLLDVASKSPSLTKDKCDDALRMTNRLFRVNSFKKGVMYDLIIDAKQNVFVQKSQLK